MKWLKMTMLTIVGAVSLNAEVYKIVVSTNQSKAVMYLDGDIRIGTSTGTANIVLQGGDSNSGYMGVGTQNPAYKIDSYGFVRSTAGFVFPDGTIQITKSVAGIGDNLGNHKSTTTLDMNLYPIINASSVTTMNGGSIGSYWSATESWYATFNADTLTLRATCTGTNAHMSLFANGSDNTGDRINFYTGNSKNLKGYISDEGLYISTINTVAKIGFTDGSTLTSGNIPAPLGDNLGDHIATQDLNMSNWEITNVANITVSTFVKTPLVTNVNNGNITIGGIGNSNTYVRANNNGNLYLNGGNSLSSIYIRDYSNASKFEYSNYSNLLSADCDLNMNNNRVYDFSNYPVVYMSTGFNNTFTTNTNYEDLVDMFIATFTTTNTDSQADIMFTAPVINTNNGKIGYFQLVYNSTQVKCFTSQTINNALPERVVIRWVDHLGAGSHYYKIQWKTSANTIRQDALSWGQRIMTLQLLRKK